VIVGVIGAGTMGAGIAQISLQAGHEVLLNDVDEAAIERGRERIENGLQRVVQKGALDSNLVEPMLARLRHAHSLASLASEVDIAVEAAFEDLGLKQEIFRALDSGARPETILATNTSALPVTEIAGVTDRPDRVVGLHFFNPAPLMPLVEVVATERTSADTVRAAVEFAEGLGKTAVVCRDAPGFIVNRVNRPFTLEALRMLESAEAGVLAIDSAVTGAGYPMGPFRLMDLVGIDVNLAVARALYEAFDGAERFRPSAVQEELVKQGTLGRKTGSGFYRYTNGGGTPALAYGADDASESSLTAAQILERIELAIINEAYHAASENVAEPPDIDRAMKLGANHPYGPFERAGSLGLRRVVEGLQALERTHGARFRVAPSLWQVAHV
jgi:3-hydroxybutyryl-CoA dehydrogenase